MLLYWIAGFMLSRKTALLCWEFIFLSCMLAIIFYLNTSLVERRESFSPEPRLQTFMATSQVQKSCLRETSAALFHLIIFHFWGKLAGMMLFQTRKWFMVDVITLLLKRFFLVIINRHVAAIVGFVCRQ